MHPSCALIVWLAAVLGAQALHYAGLTVLAGVALGTAPGAMRRWYGYVHRARWLLLTLWAILAFNTPGEALGDLVWAPTYEGVAEANLQAARLVVLLACLAWLFVRLGRDEMVAGLWGLMSPFRALGLDVERLVVRLALVLGNLERPLEKGAWRSMLAAEPPVQEGVASLHLVSARWAVRDSLVVALAGVFLIWAVQS